jgi:hypothetical protein
MVNGLELKQDYFSTICPKPHPSGGILLS